MIEGSVGINSHRIPAGDYKVKMLAMSDIKTFGIQNEFSTKMVDYEAIKKYLVPKGTIVIKNSGNYNVLYINQDDVLITDIAIKITSNNLSSEQIFKLLNSKKFRKHLSANEEGTVLKKITLKQIANFEVEETDYENAKLYFDLIKLTSIEERKSKILRNIIGTMS